LAQDCDHRRVVTFFAKSNETKLTPLSAMVRMLTSIFALSYSYSALGHRVATENLDLEADAPTCECTSTGVVDGVNTGKSGCGLHFGQRYGYICYVDNGAECAGSRLSSRTGVYWRSCRGEHQTDEARRYLLEAMEGMDKHAIEIALNIAEQRDVDPEVIAAGHARIEVVVQMMAAQEELMAAIHHDSPERLQTALVTAEELELDAFLSEDVLEEAVERYQYLQSRDKAKEDLVIAIDDVNRELLITRLATARELGVKSRETLQAGEERIAELDQMMAVATSALEASLLTRYSQQININLKEALRLFAADDDLQARTAARIEHLTIAEGAQNELLPTLSGTDLQLIMNKLATARTLDAAPDVLTQAEQRIVEIQDLMATAAAVLAAAVVAEHDGTHKASSELEAALDEINRLHSVRDCPQVSQATVREANARLDHLHEVDEATDRVIGIYHSEDMHEIITGLAWGRSHNVVQECLDKGEEQAARVRILMRDARQLMIDLTEGTDAGALQAALDEVLRLNAASPRRIRMAQERIGALTR